MVMSQKKEVRLQWGCLGTMQRNMQATNRSTCIRDSQHDCLIPVQGRVLMLPTRHLLLFCSNSTILCMDQHQNYSSSICSRLSRLSPKYRVLICYLMNSSTVLLLHQTISFSSLSSRTSARMVSKGPISTQLAQLSTSGGPLLQKPRVAMARGGSYMASVPSESVGYSCSYCPVPSLPLLWPIILSAFLPLGCYLLLAASLSCDSKLAFSLPPTCRLCFQDCSPWCQRWAVGVKRGWFLGVLLNLLDWKGKRMGVQGMLGVGCGQWVRVGVGVAALLFLLARQVEMSICRLMSSIVRQYIIWSNRQLQSNLSGLGRIGEQDEGDHVQSDQDQQGNSAVSWCAVLLCTDVLWLLIQVLVFQRLQSQRQALSDYSAHFIHPSVWMCAGGAV